MPQYLSGINVTSVTLGVNAGASLTTGDNNVLLGANAGASLTTGSGNVVVGPYTAAGEPDVTNTVLLCNGQGTVACRWDASSTPEQPLKPTADVTDPSTDAVVRTAYDPDTKALAYKLRVGGTTHVSYSATKASVDRLGVDAATLGGSAPTVFQRKADTLLLTSGSGASLIQNAATLTLRGLAVAGGLTLDASNPALITVTAPAPATLSDETTGGVPQGALTLVGASSVPGTLRTRQLVAGPGIGLTSTGAAITITNTEVSGAGVTLTNAGDAATVSLVADDTGPTLGVCGLLAGTGITVVRDDTTKAVTVGSSVSIASETGAGEGLVSVGTGAALKTKFLAAGPGITLDRLGSTGLTLSSTVTLVVSPGTLGNGGEPEAHILWRFKV